MNTPDAASPSTTKISASIHPGLLARFNKGLRHVIKRDAFLNLILEQELPYLRAELAGKRNSSAAKRYIARELRQLKPITINIVVEKEIASQLNGLVEEANLVRDAFMNFLLLCLNPKSTFFDFFDLPERVTHSVFKAWPQDFPVSPVQMINEILMDPLYYLRAAVRDRYKTGLYALQLPTEFHGLSCFLPDEQVPQTRAHRKLMKESIRWSEELESLEATAFAKKR